MSSRTKSVLSYAGLFVTGIIFLVMEKKDSFVRKNAAQSVVFSISLCVLKFCFTITPFVGGIINFLFSLFGFIVWIILIYKAYNKIYYRLPVISEISEKYVVKWFKT